MDDPFENIAVQDRFRYSLDSPWDGRFSFYNLDRDCGDWYLLNEKYKLD